MHRIARTYACLDSRIPENRLPLASLQPFSSLLSDTVTLDLGKPPSPAHPSLRSEKLLSRGFPTSGGQETIAGSDPASFSTPRLLDSRDCLVMKVDIAIRVKNEARLER